MQPRNPGTGEQGSKQPQTWIAGPEDDEKGKAVVVLASYGPDLGQGGFGMKLGGDQEVGVSWEDLRISGKYSVWSAESKGTSSSGASATHGERESQLLWLTPAG